jgi:Ca-activated chloride channel family protein
MGLKGLINDAYAVEGVGHAQAGTPIALPDVLHQQGEKLFRRSASETQSQHYYSDVDVELARQNRGEELRGRSQRFRIDARPGIQAGDHFAVTRTTPTEAETFSFSLGFERNTPPSRDQYTPIHENPFITADGPDAVSTFSIDVDTASYANVRQFLESGRLPPADAVRIEELVNYFDYDYAGPTDDKPFAAHMEVAACPWDKDHRLARIAIKGKEIARDERPQSNLVFLVDVSGSMNDPNKLPLLVEGMKMLTRELGENDRVAIVVYASSEGLALESTRGDEQETILAALDQLRAGGSTAGGAGINLAYQVALDNFIEGGTNRVILCTDGDFNVGVTDTAQLEQLAVEKAKTGVFLTVLGFGRGNLNDAMMEGISGKGNGNYHYVDNLTEARKVLVEEMAGTLVTIAKDVKIQVEFNPAQVAGYRLIGYENRLLRTEDFNDDKKDAGEIGAGHTVTALYEIIPAGQEVTPPSVDPLKYQKPLAGLAEETTKSAKPQATSDELLTLKLRYKLPDATKSTKLEFPITDKVASFADATDDFQFAAAVASFGMLLRHSQYQGETSFDAVQEIAQASLGSDPHNYRSEFLELVRIAKELTGVQTDVRSKTEGP